MLLPDGTELEVTRGDVQASSEQGLPVTEPVGRVVLEALEKEPEARLKTWRDAGSSFHRVCARYELGRRGVQGAL